MHQRLNSCKDDFWGSRSLPSDDITLRGWRRRSQGGQGCRGMTLIGCHSPGVFTSFFSLRFIVLVSLFCWLDEMDERTEGTNQSQSTVLPLRKSSSFGGSLNVCDEWMSCWCFYRTKPLGRNVSTRVSSLPGLLLQVHSNTGWHHQNRCWTVRKTRFISGKVKNVSRRCQNDLQTFQSLFFNLDLFHILLWSLQTIRVQTERSKQTREWNRIRVSVTRSKLQPWAERYRGEPGPLYKKFWHSESRMEFVNSPLKSFDQDLRTNSDTNKSEL